MLSVSHTIIIICFFLDIELIEFANAFSLLCTNFFFLEVNINAYYRTALKEKYGEEEQGREETSRKHLD